MRSKVVPHEKLMEEAMALAKKIAEKPLLAVLLAKSAIAADNAKFGQTGPRVGSPADGLCVAYFTFVVGAKKAREIWMLTKQYSAAEALDMGLVNVVVPLEKLDEEVDSWCERILAHSPECISILKATFDSVFDYLDGSLGRFQNLISPDFFDGMDVREAQSAFFEKRKPNFWKHRAK